MIRIITILFFLFLSSGLFAQSGQYYNRMVIQEYINYDTNNAYFDKEHFRYEFKNHISDQIGIHVMYKVRWRYLGKFDMTDLTYAEKKFKSNKRKYFCPSETLIVLREGEFIKIQTDEHQSFGWDWEKKIDTIRIEHFKNYRLHGKYTYIEPWRKKTIGNYYNGLKEGLWYSIDMSNNLRYTEFYHEGKVINWTWFYKNHFIDISGIGSQECPEKVIKYDTTGRVMATFHFNDCKLTKWLEHHSNGETTIRQGNFSYNKSNPDYYGVTPLDGDIIELSVTGDTISMKKVNYRDKKNEE